MLPLLQPRFPLGLAIACAAVWCALAIGGCIGLGRRKFRTYAAAWAAAKGDFADHSGRSDRPCAGL